MGVKMKYKVFVGNILNSDYKMRFENRINRWLDENKIKKENIVSIKQSESEGWITVSVFYEC